MARNRSRIFRGGRQVRQSLWIGLGETNTALVGANTAALILSLNTAALALRPFTVVRTRGFLGVRSDQAAVSESYDGALGLAVVSDQASAIGVTAVPTPFTDLGSDMFFVHEMLFGRFSFLSSIGHQANLIEPWKSFDSKAMRKVDDDQDVVVTIESSSLSSGTVVTTAARMLVKLH